MGQSSTKPLINSVARLVSRPSGGRTAHRNGSGTAAKTEPVCGPNSGPMAKRRPSHTLGPEWEGSEPGGVCGRPDKVERSGSAPEVDIYHRSLGFYNNPDFPYQADFGRIQYLAEACQETFA